MIVLGFDYGEKWIGVAVGSTDTGLAEPLGTFTNSDHLFSDISSVVTTHCPSQLVVGVSEQESARQAARFAARLARETSLPTELVDETLSTHEAKELIQHERRRRKRISIHAASAAVILERWFIDHGG